MLLDRLDAPDVVELTFDFDFSMEITS